ncbi:MAG TPA: ribonuclease D [Stellaceae bacterium]|jgi:ribonuclease D|nr:ribonuclease D [Stellaceae bacterium]
MDLITDNGALAQFCAGLAGADFITVDTEFMREKTYWPILCLVQIAGPDSAAAIDPLAPGLDLAPMLDLLADRRVLKVFHAARQDIEIFVRLTGTVPAPIFDTQIAAMVCGFGESVGYETLAAKLAGAAIDKSSRFTDWSRRPLSERQLQYALADVVPLRKVYEKLAARLEKTGRSSWLADEMAILNDAKTYRTDPVEAWRRLKPRTNNRRTLGLVRELAAWRELAAQKRDLPRNRVVRDEALLEIASHPPKTIDDLARIRAFGRSLAEGKLGAEILAVVERARDVPEADLPELPAQRHLPAGIGPLVELLRVLLRLCAEESGVAPRLIADNDDLEAIATDDAAAVPALSGWRGELFGRDALDLKHGRLALTASGKKIERLHLGASPAAAAQ